MIRHNRTRREKRLWTEAVPGDRIAVHRASDEHAEAFFVGDTIEHLHIHDQRAYADFAILYRVNAESRIFEKVFVSRGIPYRIVGGLRFYDREEIKDTLAYLRVLHNPADSVSLKRIINKPPRDRRPDRQAPRGCGPGAQYVAPRNMPPRGGDPGTGCSRSRRSSSSRIS